jgi:hypothetical protein
MVLQRGRKHDEVRVHATRFETGEALRNPPISPGLFATISNSSCIEKAAVASELSLWIN